MRMAVFRTGHFNAAHRLYVHDWSEEKNLEVFGKCSWPHFHGHNYEIEVKVVGEVDPKTGLVIDLKDLKIIIEEEVEEKFDHKNLNLDIPEFKELPPSVENLCYLCWKILSENLGDQYEVTVRLYETPRNYAEFPV